MHRTSSRPSKCAASTRPWPANAALFADQHRVGEAKFADRGGDLRDLLVAVRARVSGIGDQRRAGARLRRHLPFPFRYPVAHEGARARARAREDTWLAPDGGRQLVVMWTSSNSASY